MSRLAGLRRDDVVDVAGAVIATGLGVVGFRTSFEGSGFLVPGLLGSLCGGLVVWVVARLRLPSVVGTAAAVVAFFVFSGIAVPTAAVAGVVPTPSSIGDVVDGVVNGWADLLTTIPPAGQEGNLLAIPYASGFAGAALGLALALAVRRYSLCVVPPIAVLGTSILFGTDRPASLLLQGGAFAAVLLAWLSAREARRHDVVVRRQRGARAATAAALLAASIAVGLVAGPSLPLADARERYILREQVEPEFDPDDRASPLAGYRNFTGVDAGDDALEEPKTFLLARNLPPSTPVRVAVMDGYDGLVWTVGGDVRSGAFEGVGGEVLPGARDGERVEVQLEVGDLSGVWLPSVGAPASVRFDGERADALRGSLRFNETLGTAAVAAGLRTGDRYTMTAVVTADVREEEPERLADASFDQSFVRTLEIDPDPLFATRAAEAVAGFTTDYDKASRLERWFREGAAPRTRNYSDGGEGANVPPGHTLFRLGQFLRNPNDLRGNGEQYAAAMGLLATRLGMPARVVLGFWPDEDSPGLTSETVEAWVEIAFSGVGWVPFRPTPDRSNIPPEETLPEPEPNRVASQPPPPTTIPPPPAVPEQIERQDADDERDDDARETDGGLPKVLVYGAAGLGVPVLTIGVPCAVVLALKRRRRQRRRRTGPPARRIAGGWAELLDLARDLGNPVPTRATRREVASYLRLEPVANLAARADDSTFGASDPDETAAHAYWTAVEGARRSLLDGVGRTARLRAALNLTSLRTRTA